MYIVHLHYYTFKLDVKMRVIISKIEQHQKLK
jgi:hypothetical protein